MGDPPKRAETPRQAAKRRAKEQAAAEERAHQIRTAGAVATAEREVAAAGRGALVTAMEAASREEVLDRLTRSARVSIQDVLEEAAPGRIRLRDLTKVPAHVARAVKRVKITDRTSGPEGMRETTQTVEVELAHHLDYDERLGKVLGLWSGEGGTHLHQHAHLHLAGVPEGELRARLAALTEQEAKPAQPGEDEDP